MTTNSVHSCLRNRNDTTRTYTSKIFRFCLYCKRLYEHFCSNGWDTNHRYIGLEGVDSVS